MPLTPTGKVKVSAVLMLPGTLPSGHREESKGEELKLESKLKAQERITMEVKCEGGLQCTVSQVGRWNQPWPLTRAISQAEPQPCRQGLEPHPERGLFCDALVPNWEVERQTEKGQGGRIGNKEGKATIGSAETWWNGCQHGGWVWWGLHRHVFRNTTPCVGVCPSSGK